MADLTAPMEQALAIGPDRDPSIGRALRRRLLAAVIVLGGATMTVVLLTTGSHFSPPVIVKQSVLSLAIVVGLGLGFRKKLLHTRYNRRIAALVSFPIAAFLLHRVAALATGSDARATLIGDAIIQAVAMALGAVFIERWMMWDALLALGFVGIAWVFGDAALVAFPLMLFACAAVAVISWRGE